MRLPILETVKYVCIDGTSFDSEDDARNYSDSELSDCIINNMFLHSFEKGEECLLKHNNTSFYLVKIIDEVVTQKWKYSEELNKKALHSYNTLIVEVINSNPVKRFNITKNGVSLLTKIKT